MKWFWVLVSKFFDKRNGMVRNHVKKPKLHWVRAQKPISEMTQEERNNFSLRLANEILKNARDK